MKKNPFVNCGEQIKKFVRIIYKIFMILSVGGGVVLTVCGLSEGGPEEVIFWVGIVVAIALPIIIHISSLCLYGFGEIVANAEAQIVTASGESPEKTNEIPSL